MTSSESHVVAAWTRKTIFASYPTFILLFNLRTQSLTLNSLSSISRYALLMITSALPFTTRTLTPTPTLIISPHIPAIAKKVFLAIKSCGFAVCVLKTQIFWKRAVKWCLSLNSVDTPDCLQNDLQAIRRLDRAGVLNNHNPSNQRSEMIPLFLTYHPFNERIKRILLCNFNILSSHPETRAVFPQPPMVAYRRDSNLRDILVHTSDCNQSSFQAGTSPCLHARCRSCLFISSDTSVRGPQNSFVIKKAFSCQTSGLVYCISCRHCPALYIGETGRTLRQRFGEHFRSIEQNLPGFPVAEHFNTAGHSIDDALVQGIMLSVDNAQRERLDFNLAPVSRVV